MKIYSPPSVDTLNTFHALPEMYLVLSPSFHILTASDLYLSSTYRSRMAIEGKYIFDIFPNNPDDSGFEAVEILRAALSEVVQTNSANAMPILRYDLEDLNTHQFVERYWSISHTPVFDADGQLSYIIQLVKEVTELVLESNLVKQQKVDQQKSLIEIEQLNGERELMDKKLTKTLKELRETNLYLEEKVKRRTDSLKLSEEKYRNLIEQSPVAMQVFRGEDMVFEVVNEAMLTFLGKEPDIIGKTLFQGVPEIVGQPIVDVLYNVYRNGVPFELMGEEVILERNGQKIVGFYDVIYRPVYELGKISGVLGIALDVTHQVSSQRSLAASEQRFRTMAEASDILISTNDAKGNLNYLNHAWVNLTGWQTKDLKNFDWSSFVHPNERAEVEEIFASALTAHSSFFNEFRILDKVGNYRWLRIKGNPIFDGSGNFDGFICSSLDVTEEKQYLLEIQSVNKALIEANESQFLINEKLQQANNKLKLSEENLQSAFNAGELGSCSLDLKTGIADMSGRYRSLYGLPVDGEITWEMVLESVEPDFIPEVNKVLENAVKFGSPVDSTYAIRHLISGERRWMRVVGKVNQDIHGVNESVYAVVMDVTPQKEDEQRKNDFIAMVSHELKTPVTSITGYLQVLQRLFKNTGDDFTGSVLDKMGRQLTKMTTMINGFLNVSRLESGKIHLDRQRFNFAELLADIEDEYKHIVSTHNIQFTSSEEIILIGDRDKIGHVVNNLISNAVKYSPIHSKILLSCTKANDTLTFSVKDEGEGIPEEDLPHLFDRYYRVQNVEARNIAGFGIGLYLSAEIIKSHSGEIWVESVRGEGSTFYVSLPLNS